MRGARGPPLAMTLALLLGLHCGCAAGSAIPSPTLLEEMTSVTATAAASTTANTDQWSTELPATQPPIPRVSAGESTAFTGGISSETDISTTSGVESQGYVSVPATAWSASTTDEQQASETTSSNPDATQPDTAASPTPTQASSWRTTVPPTAPQRTATVRPEWVPFEGADEECRPGTVFRVDCNLCICPTKGWRRHAQCSNNACPMAGRHRRYRRAPGNGERCAPNIRYMDECNLCICSADGIKAHSSCTFAQCPQKPR